MFLFLSKQRKSYAYFDAEHTINFKRPDNALMYFPTINLISIKPYFYFNPSLTNLLRSTMKMTHFENGLVMGSADCLYYAGLVKTPEKLFKRKLGPLPDTLQAGACVFPPFQILRGQK